MILSRKGLGPTRTAILAVAIAVLPTVAILLGSEPESDRGATSTPSEADLRRMAITRERASLPRDIIPGIRGDYVATANPAATAFRGPSDFPFRSAEWRFQ